MLVSSLLEFLYLQQVSVSIGMWTTSNVLGIYTFIEISDVQMEQQVYMHATMDILILGLTFRWHWENIKRQGQISSMLITPLMMMHNVHLYGKSDYLTGSAQINDANIPQIAMFSKANEANLVP